MKKIIYTIFSLAILGGFSSCSEKELDPTTAINKSVEDGINSQEDLQGILYGAYNRMSDPFYYGRDLIIFGEVRSDNAFSNGTSGRFITPAAMDLVDSDAYARDTWSQMYSAIANTNIIINQDPTVLEGDQDEIMNIQGQALALRALIHYDLVRLYGQQHVNNGGENALGVPYVMDYKGDDLSPSRNTVGEVKAFVYDDLNTALTMMSADLNSSCEVLSTNAVNAIISRVALYFSDFGDAETAAKKVIDSQDYSIISAANFSSTYTTDCTTNAIFELAVDDTDNPGINGLAYIYRGTSYGDIQPLNNVLDLFGDDDVRASEEMIGYEGTTLRNLGKYPDAQGFDNLIVIRYEEVVLNYAEALLENGSAEEALIWLNKIPANRNADAYTVATKSNILLERRKELIFEGFRFDDLSRTMQSIPNPNPLQASHGGPEYGSYKYAFPIPLVELNANSNISQNEGY